MKIILGAIESQILINNYWHHEFLGYLVAQISYSPTVYSAQTLYYNQIQFEFDYQSVIIN